ncbi:MAG: SDR family oxidoreductase [Ruminococcaceae bacterium]|nr:SDR family oxidoreductase [Oscillospiraceae bacterium]
MDIRFENKIVLVTGAAGGIGRAIVQGFLESGATVAACDLSGTKEKLSDMKTPSLFCYDFDITDADAVEKAMEKIAADCGKIDVLVNNAGINVGPEQRKTVEHFDDNWWHAIQNVDVNGVYHCAKHVIPHMPENGGAIINISSIVGLVPLRNQCSFAAAKAAVINLTKAMALEMAEKHIRVNAIAPGTVGIAVTNELWKDNSAMAGLLSHIPQGRQGRPEEIANAVLFMASDAASYITGTVLPVDGGWTAGGFARNF